jgi:branched-chain amino acid transport system permease protein
MDTQWIINAIADASIYLLVAVGFGLVYRTVHFFDFSFAALLCVAPYAALGFQSIAGVKVVPAIICGTLATAITAVLLEICFFSRLRFRNASKSTSLLVSLGLFLVIRNLIASIWGDQALLLQQTDAKIGYAVLGGRMTALQMWTVFSAITIAAGVGMLLARSRLGRCIKAVGDDCGLAKVFGISEPWVIGSAYAISAISVSVAGLSLALDVGTTPNLGFRPFLFAVVAVILAGSFSVWRIVIASVLVATVQNFLLWRLGAQWQEGGIFGIFLIILVARSFNKKQLSNLKNS